MSQEQEPPADVDAEVASAQIEAMIAELGPDKAREMLELLLTEIVVKNDPESQE